MDKRFSSAGAENNSVAAIASTALRAMKSLTPKQLFQRINGEPGQQLGIEICRFLWQNLSCKRNVTDLLHAHGIHQECDVGLPLPYLPHRFIHIAKVTDVPLFANGIL